MKWIIVICLVATAGVYGYGHNHSRKPSLMLWVWETPNDLTYIDRDDVGIAYLAGSIEIGNQTNYRPRFVALNLNEKIYKEAVIRVDLLTNGELSENKFDIVQFIVQTCSRKGVNSCQIDFDAKVSQYAWYVNLLIEVRSKLRRTTDLSMTGLPSWCYPNSWLTQIEKLNIEVVPMLYRMGKDSNNIIGGQVPDNFLSAPSCLESVGVSLDEEFDYTRYTKNKRIYVFSPLPWTEETYNQVYSNFNE